LEFPLESPVESHLECFPTVITLPEDASYSPVYPWQPHALKIL
jgi:hypothetical protein